MSRRYGIPLWTLAGWIKNIQSLEKGNLLKAKCRLAGAGRKSDSFEYDEILVNFIKEGREHGIFITSSEVICKAIKFDFEKKVL